MYPLTRCSKQSRAIFLAFHVAAARGFRRAMADPLSPEEVVEVTASSLRSYMVRRAAVCPLARTVLLWTRFQAAVQAIQVPLNPGHTFNSQNLPLTARTLNSKR